MMDANGSIALADGQPVAALRCDGIFKTDAARDITAGCWNEATGTCTYKVNLLRGRLHT